MQGANRNEEDENSFGNAFTDDIAIFNKHKSKANDRLGTVGDKPIQPEP